MAGTTNPTESVTATFQFWAFDAAYSQGSSFTYACSLDTAAPVACANSISYGPLAYGAHVFTVQATDPAGQTGSGSFSWTIQQQTATVVPPPPAAVPPAPGYWTLRSDGIVDAFGQMQCGETPSVAVPVGDVATNIETTPSGGGHWVVDGKGEVYTCGDAGYFGGSPRLAPGDRVTSISATADGLGYWLFTSAGRVVPYGDASFLGDMSQVHLNGAVLGSVATPTGNGYYMVASDGGIFTFGDASFQGSMGGTHLNQPVVGLAPAPSGTGYWLVAADGGVFAFHVPFRGSMGGTHLNQPVAGMVAYGDGYLMVAADGGVFNFSDRAFAGSMGANPPPKPVVAITPQGRA